VYIEYDGYIPEPEDPLDPDPPEGKHHYYNTDYNVFARVLEPYLHGDLTFIEARKKLYRSSPWVWGEWYMENVQIHHGVDDTLGRVAQTEAWQGIFYQGENGNEFRIYDKANHTIEGTDEDNYYYYESYDDATADWLQAIIDGD